MSQQAPLPPEPRERIGAALGRRFVLRYLRDREQDYCRRYPQLSCPAFDHITRHIMVDGRYEAAEIDWIAANLREHIVGRTVLDVGANIGNHSLAFAQLARRVVAIEPHPLNFALLQLNVRNCANVSVIQAGASDHAGRARARTPAANLGATSIDARWEGEEVEFDILPLDTLPDLTNVGLVKLDVEGHEAQALRGMRETLVRDRPAVVLEQHAADIQSGSSAAVELLRSIGYPHLLSIDAGRKWRRPLGGLGSFVEALLFGAPPVEAIVRPVQALETRDYACLVATTEPL